MDSAVKIRGFNAQQRFLIDDESKVGEARRAAQTLASFEFTAEIAGKVAIAATELARNLLRHARGGELLVQKLDDGRNAAIELLSIDRGPGMRDVARCMTDGYSTAGTPGTGLGAVRRLAGEFDIHSAPGHGTIVMARFGDVLTTRFGAVSVALEGEIECGDSWHLEHRGDETALLVVDGLGHGTFAAAAARAAVGAFDAAPFDQPQDVMTRANGHLSKTRGGAAACARISGNRVSYAGVGNISGALVANEKSQGLVSHNGTLGINHRATQQFEYTRAPGALLVMHTDGISARWDLKHRPDVLVSHPAIVAAMLYRDHARGRDDATVVVLA
jgi:anti-sigma regulatory factor (Ser/Thr protein kinase)